VSRQQAAKRSTAEWHIAGSMPVRPLHGQAILILGGDVEQ
jgi:hypothetical protein